MKRYYLDTSIWLDLFEVRKQRCRVKARQANFSIAPVLENL